MQLVIMLRSFQALYTGFENLVLRKLIFVIGQFWSLVWIYIRE